MGTDSKDGADSVDLVPLVVDVAGGFTLVLMRGHEAVARVEVRDEKGSEPVVAWCETASETWALLAIWRALQSVLVERGIKRVLARVFDSRMATVMRRAGWADDSVVLRFGEGVDLVDSVDLVDEKRVNG